VSSDGAQGSEDRTIARAGAVREATFQPSVGAIREARRFVATAVPSREGSEDGERMALVTSELASNAVLHVGSAFTVSVSVSASGRSVRIAVLDRSSLGPTSGPTAPGAVTGRGLAIVDALATEWGVDDSPDPGGKWVWAELALHPDLN
jgi:serine/threonine-protein kinase RsbW